MGKKSKLQLDTNPWMGMLPKGLLFKTFGGFKNKEAERIANSTEAALLEHMQRHNLTIDVGYSNDKWHLVFVQKPEGDVSNDL